MWDSIEGMSEFKVFRPDADTTILSGRMKVRGADTSHQIQLKIKDSLLVPISAKLGHAPNEQEFQKLFENKLRDSLPDIDPKLIPARQIVELSELDERDLLFLL